jgi:hypothetical protein
MEHASVEAYNSSLGAQSHVMVNPDDGYFSMQLPNGTWEVSIGYCGEDTCFRNEPETITIEDNDVVVLINEDGITSIDPRIHTAQATGEFAFRVVHAGMAEGLRFAVTLPASGYSVLDLIDLQGRHKATVYRGELARGFHELGLENSSLTSGFYIARLRVTGQKRFSAALKVLIRQ